MPNPSDEDEKAISLMWDYSSEAVDYSISRFTSLDEKAKAYFSFGGVILALITSSAKFVAVATPDTLIGSVPILFFAATIVLLVEALYYTLSAYRLRPISFLPDPKILSDWYRKPQQDKTQPRLQKLLIVKAGECVASYAKANEFKADALGRAETGFQNAMGMLVAFIITFAAAIVYRKLLAGGFPQGI